MELLLLLLGYFKGDNIKLKRRKRKDMHTNKCERQKECIYLPSDIGEVNFSNLLKFYNQGRLIVECVTNANGQIVALFPRPPYANLPGVIRDCKKVESFCKFYNNGECMLCSRPEIHSPLKVWKEWKKYFYVLEELAFHIFALERGDNEKYFDHDQCKECGGDCCKSAGCELAPSDFSDLSFEGLRRVMKKGYITMQLASQLYTGLNCPVLILHIRNRDEPIINFGGWHEEGCILHDNLRGCPFSDKDRPKGGRDLIPENRKYGTCARGYSIRMCAEDWLPYQGLLEALGEEFAGKEIACKGT